MESGDQSCAPLEAFSSRITSEKKIGAPSCVQSTYQSGEQLCELRNFCLAMRNAKYSREEQRTSLWLCREMMKEMWFSFIS